MTGVKGLRRGANIYLPAAVDAGALAYKAANTREAWLTPGTSGNVLTSQGSTPNIPAYAAPTGGGGGGTSNAGALVPLARQVASSSAQLDFTTFISSTYDKYLIVGEALVLSVSGAHLGVQFGSGSGPTWDTGATNKYEWAGAGMATSSAGVNDSGATGMNRIFASMATGTAYGFGSFELMATNLQSTTLRKSLNGYGIHGDSSPKQVVQVKEIVWTDTSVTTGLRFIPSSGNIVSGSITIYGIANAATQLAGGALVLLGEYTASSAASLDLASRNAVGLSGNLFQADFDRYRVEVQQCRGVTDATNLRARAIVSGSADSSALYTYTTLASVAGGIGGGGGGDTTLVTGIDFPGNTTVAGTSISPVFEVVNPLGSLHKQFSSINVHKGRISTGDARRIGFWTHGFYESSNVVTGLQLLMSSGNIESITVRVYGISKVAISTATGKIVQVVSTETSAFASGSTLTPYDDTIPQNTEGDQYFSLTITPKSASSTLLIECNGLWGAAGSSAVLTVALFQDSGANAIAASNDFIANNGAAQLSHFRHFMVAGTTSATTFKIRAGVNATSCYLNGPGARRYGGVAASTFSITEILP